MVTITFREREKKKSTHRNVTALVCVCEQWIELNEVKISTKLN
jgi:hypothetical protein